MNNSCPVFAVPGGEADTVFNGLGRSFYQSKDRGRRPFLQSDLPHYCIFFPGCLRVVFFICLMLLSGVSSAASSPTYAFWYGPAPPMDLLSQFDRIIVEADNISDEQLKTLKQHGAKVLAYLSIGEWNPRHSAMDAVDPDWILGSNPHWNSRIMDLSAAGWQQFLQDRAAILKKRGFEGLFLDTLDSHMVPEMSPGKRKRQQQGLVNILRRFKANQPDFFLAANRGFEVMDRIAPYLNAVAAESLYHGWDNNKKQYLPVDRKERLWLIQTLTTIQSRHHLDIVVIDYLPPRQRETARQTARKIERDGFIPWIANPSLDYMGVGALEAVPRKILMLYDGRRADEDFTNTSLHRLCAPVFQYLGYLPEYADINLDLPREILKGRYSGIVVWLTAPPARRELSRWLARKMEETLPVLLLGDLTAITDKKLLSSMGLSLGPNVNLSRAVIVKKSDLIGFEADEPGRIDHLLPVTASERRNNRSHLRIEDGSGNGADLVVTGDWGGLAHSSALLDEDFTNDALWVIDPFAFFKQALQLPSIPVPDVTTENGRRLLLVHVDGDGFMEKFEKPGKGYAAKVLLEEIFKVYPFPHTVSIIEGEISLKGAHPEIASQLESIAREIFALKNVEIASHSYSHPLRWSGGSSNDPSYKYFYPTKGYTFNLEREISGSVHYIDSRLAPPGKKARVFLWTGDGLPPFEAMAILDRMGLLNMNGEGTSIHNAQPSLTGISGLGRPFANGAYQTYAPISNEDSYTNNWNGPFIGYQRVVETFRLTDTPRRLKPIGIYYHFYSGSKIASLRALKKVYDWAITQETFPVPASEYILKVLNFRKIGVGRKSDGSFRVIGLDHLQTLRLDPQRGGPEVQRIRGLAGWRKLAGGTYLHGSGGSTAEFSLSKIPDDSLRLYQTNGRVLKWWPKADGGIYFQIQGTAPVRVEIANATADCRVRYKQGLLAPIRKNGNILTFSFPDNDTGGAELYCHG